MDRFTAQEKPGSVYTICTYHLAVREQVDEETFNATSPYPIKVVRTDLAGTRFTTQADQSGLIGLIRQLHGQGLVLLSVYREIST
jgi:hypothetical protein